jgi:hypothetical protein
MASPYNFITIAEYEIDTPDIFLPTSMRYDGNEIIWTKPGYATYRGTPVNHEMAESTILCDPSSVALPPNMERISKSESPTEHQMRYIQQYKSAAATVDHWKSSKHPREDTLGVVIANWKLTCDKLTSNPYFSEGWNLPAFFPIYSYQCFAGITNFFAAAPFLHPDKPTSLWREQTSRAEEMYASWEALFHYVTFDKCIPFPKCLWYHKYHYVCQRKQPETWKRFFKNTTFSEWGRNN